MKKFLDPELIVLDFAIEDVITTSGDGFDDDGEDMGGWG